jgi:NAD(P)-dependent dehydrogenase (short-subunit alcohol dehydrogenase family)
MSNNQNTSEGASRHAPLSTLLSLKNKYAISLYLAEPRVKVIIADQNRNSAKQKAEDLNSLGYDASPMQVDIFDALTVNDLPESVVSNNRGINILAFNAGIFSNYYFENMSLEEISDNT